MTGFEPATSLATDGISLTRMPFGIVSCLLSALYHLNYTAPFSIPCFMKIIAGTHYTTCRIKPTPFYLFSLVPRHQCCL